MNIKTLKNIFVQMTVWLENMTHFKLALINIIFQSLLQKDKEKLSTKLIFQQKYKYLKSND
ncbi:hypothetical protein C3F34_10795 [Acinetobacter sp. ACNIH2]|nr:hypothetical protein C3F34_10795 [Acinetobacter sp. ACNIH2]